MFSSILRTHLLAGVLLLRVGVPLHAQAPPPIAERQAEAEAAPVVGEAPAAPPKHSFARGFLKDEGRIWAAPFRRSTYDSRTLKYGLSFLALTGALIASDHKTADLLPNTFDQSIWSGRVSQIGAAYTLAGFSGATYLFGKATGDKHAAEAGLLALEAIGHTQLVVFGMKKITRRERPLANGNHGGFWQGGDSFPSGHSASVFATATVFSYEYRDHAAVPIAAYSVAALVSASRLSARKHWVSDIFVGSAVGFLLGRYVYRSHHDPTLPGRPVKSRLRLTPELDFGGRTASLYWKW
jgi:membrane-associated phospholipid phosphatase